MPLLTLALLWLGAAPAAQLQPRTYLSPSGGWSLRVEPLTREGTGEADYTLTGGGREAWKKRHPFALWDAGVTDDGRVAGYAYVGAGPDWPSWGSLHVVVLSPEGEVLLDEPHERQSSRFPHSPADPRAIGLFLQAESKRLVVRISDEDVNRQAEMWWTYDLETGAPLFQVRPKLELDLEPAIRSALAVRAIPNTPLVLVHWYRFQSASKPWARGAVFQLLDAERHGVWRLDLPHDYDVREDEAAGDRSLHEVWEKGGILGTGPRRFELRHAAEGLRVTYEITQDTNGVWKVGEVARGPYLVEKDDGPTMGEPFQPTLLREVVLGGTAPPKAEIRDITAFGFDDQGRLRFARAEQEGTTLVQLSGDGELRHATPVSLQAAGEERIAWYPLTSPRWLAVKRSYEEDTRARAWLVDEDTGAHAELPEFPGQDVARAAELPGGRLVFLGTWHFKYTMSDALCALGPGGSVLWTVGEDYQDPSKLFSPEDVAVTSDGKVVVLDNIRKALQVFSDQGEYLATIDLKTAWAQTPNYPSSIVADRDGGVLIHDFNGKTALWRMGLDGSVRAQLDARMRDGQPREEYRRAIRFAPDGRMWTTDGHEFVRLDEQGVADLQLGQPARLDWLESPGTSMIDSTFGRLLVLDNRTRAVHVFDAEGQRVTLCRPRSEDLPDLRYSLRMMCTSSGGVLVAATRHTNRYVRFEPDGASRGVEKLAGVRAAFVTDRDAYWSVVKGAPSLTGPDGQHEIELTTLTDGRWWRSIEDLAVATDGTLAVLDLSKNLSGTSRQAGAGFVARFDAAGQPLDEYPLPEDLGPYLLAHAGPWILLSHFGPPAILLDTRDGSLRAVELGDQVDARAAKALGLAPDASELWVLEAENRRLLRFSMPD